jgi:hypothetical protein
MRNQAPSIKVGNGCLVFIAFILLLAIALTYYIGPWNIVIALASLFCGALGIIIWPTPIQRRYNAYRLYWQCALLWLLTIGGITLLVYLNV